jgi:queuosine precursor transporter
MKKLTDPALKKLLVALVLYLTAIFAANTLGLKIMPFIFGTHLSVAVFSFPVVFLMTDVVGEIYGRAIAKQFVYAGFLSIAIFIALSYISLWMPWAENGMWVKDSYEEVFGISIRMAIASLVAFLIAEYQDVVAFFFFKEKLGKDRFWLRSFLSNLWSQLLDTTLFMIIAFVGVYSFDTIVGLIIAWWLYKVAMGIIYTPLSYLGLRLLRDNTKE